MSYNQKEQWVLRNTQILDDFNGQLDEWKRIGKISYRFARDIYPDADRIRVDDVAPPLTEALQGNPVFRQIMRNRHQRAGFYYAYFADLILDTLWKEITESDGGQPDGAAN